MMSKTVYLIIWKKLRMLTLDHAHEHVLERLAVADNGRDGAFEDDSPLVDDGRGVAGLFDLRQQMRIKDDGHAFPLESLHDAPHVADAERVQAAYRFVKHQELGARDHGRGKPDA